MRISKDDIPTKIDAPGAVARLATDFGEASGTIGAEYYSLAKGTDLAPLLQGLDHDSCRSAHWGYLISGDMVVTYDDGNTERCTTGDVFHWPPHHSVRADADSEVILFSPQADHVPVMDHILTKLSTAAT